MIISGMKKIILTFVFGFSALLSGCGGQEENLVGDGSPVVTSTFPASGTIGEPITISGMNFGSEADRITVTFDRIPAEILSFDPVAERLVVELPDGGWDSEQNIFMQVAIGDKLSRRYPFTLKILPYLLHATESIGIGGDEIEISGRRFSSDISRNKVYFDNTEATILSAATNLLRVLVPDLGNQKSANIKVVVDGEFTSNTITFVNDLDRINIRKIQSAAWTTETIKTGIVWKKAYFSAFGSSMRNVNVLEITPSLVSTIDIAYGGSLRTVTTWCQNASAVAGVNASYFTTTGSADYFRYNGLEITAGRQDNTDYVDAALVINGKDDISIVSVLPKRNVTAKTVMGKTVMVAGPLLVSSGTVVTPLSSTEHFTLTHPRTAIGVTADKKILLVTVDGRRETMVGLPIRDLSVLMKALNATGAMNLDGGGSTNMYIQNKGIVNTPSESGRSVANVIYVK